MSANTGTIPSRGCHLTKRPIDPPLEPKAGPYGFEAGGFSDPVHRPMDAEKLCSDGGIRFVPHAQELRFDGFGGTPYRQVEEVGFEPLVFPGLDPHARMPTPEPDGITPDLDRDPPDVPDGYRFFFKEAMFPVGGQEYEEAFEAEVLEVGEPSPFPPSPSPLGDANSVAIDELQIH